MKTTNSTRFEFDFRNIKDILISVITWILSLYIVNQNEINSILSNYIDKDTLAITIMILVYASKKYLTDYNK